MDYGFANMKSAKHTKSGLPIAVQKCHGQTLRFETEQEAEIAMREYARKHRVSVEEFVVAPITDLQRGV